MFNNIGEKSDDDAETWCPCTRSIPTTKTGIQKFEQMLHMMIIRQQRYLEVIPNHAHGLIDDYVHSVVGDEDVAWLQEHNHIIYCPAPGSVSYRKGTAACQLQNSCCEDEMHWLSCCSRICVVGGYFSGALPCGQMGNHLACFGEVLGLFLVCCSLYYYIIHIHA